MMEQRRDVYTRYSSVQAAGSPLYSDKPMLRADGHMTFREFIAVVEKLWENIHPDIPIRPTQSEEFAKYPVIVYSLELRKSHPSEPKAKYREEIVDDDGTIYSIYGHRLDNLIAFSAVTRNNPKLAEAIIEQFELFMDEYVGTLKQLGASEIVFSRRMSDRDENRTNEDVDVRTAVYKVTLERVNYVAEAKLESIRTEVRTFLEYQRVPSFEVTEAQVGTNEITLIQKNVIVKVGDLIVLKSIDNRFFRYPYGTVDGNTYLVSAVTTDTSTSPATLTLNLTTPAGVDVEFASSGKGVWLHTVRDNLPVAIIDQQAEGATPSY